MFLHLPKLRSLTRLLCIVLCLAAGKAHAQDPIHGTFTINSALPTDETNFQTFTEAVFQLEFGVDGPVVFNVAPGSGPYVEQININAVAGASAINTITFNGNGATLENTSTNPVARAVMKLDGARHVILNNLVFHAINTASQTSYAWGVALVRNADSNTVKNCTINIDVVNQTSGQNTIGIYIGSSDDFPDNNGVSNCDYNIIDNNTINGGYDGIDLNNFAGNFGFEFTSMDFNQITNNKITNFLHSGIHMIWNRSTLVKGNDISVVSVQSIYGIQADEKNSNLRIEGNRIHGFTAAAGTVDNTFKGIEIVNSPGSPSTINSIIDNVIYDINTIRDQQGIVVSGSSYINVYHNTVLLNSSIAGSGGTRGFNYEQSNFNVNFKNNIIHIERTNGGTGYGIYAEAATSAFGSDYNDIYVTGSNNFGRNISTTYATLAAWQTATLRDVHSTSQDPLYANLAAGDLKPTSVALDNLGTPVPVPTDFNGDVRNNNTPDIGAYEFLTPPCNTPVNAGTSVAIPAAAACIGVTRTLNLSGNTFGSGQTYQWQSSTTINGTYVNVGSSSVTPLIDINPTSDLYYRALVGCGPGSATSVPVLIKVRGQLSGTYTINSAAATDDTNFNSFTDLMSALDCGGINGPVVLNVTAGSGPYNEQLVLGAIPGSSATNTIRINGNGATLTYLALNTNARGIVKLVGTKYVTINNLNIVGTGSASGQYGYGVQLLNDADFNRITNCTITVAAASTSPNFAGVVIGGLDNDPITNTDSKCDFNVIANNTIVGGYYGLIVSADPAIKVNNDSIINNVVRDHYAYGIYIKGTNNSSVEGNDVMRPARTNTTSSYTGIYLNGISTGLTVAKNKVHASHSLLPNDTGAPIAIFSNNCDATSANPNTFSNNVIYDFGALGSVIGIDNVSSDYNLYYHNTVSLDRKVGSPASGSTARGIFQNTVATGLVYRNNVVTITRSGAGTNHAFYLNTNTTSFTASNNNYYVAGTGTNRIGFKNSVNYNTVPEWITGSANDANSKGFDPVYADLANGNLTPTNLDLDNLGITTSITTDILGLTRSATTPDMGAYEFTGTLPVRLISFNAAAAGNDAAITWSTASELNTHHFVVERSVDGNSFTGAGEVAANGNSAVVRNYRFTDVNANAVSNVIYYRLKIVDNDGRAEYSNVVVVRFGSVQKVQIGVSPNPFVSSLNARIVTGTAGMAKIRVADVAGRIISTQTQSIATGTTLVTIAKADQLPAGVYFVTIDFNGATYVQKVVK